MAGKVGFIGLGAMGGPMALNLVKAGFTLVVNDIDAAKAEPLKTKGCEVAASAQAVAAAADRTIVIVETTEQAESVIIGAHGIIRGAKPGHIVLCMSTIDPFAARIIADRLASLSIAMLDAPVSGGTGRAQSGELSGIVGGDAAVVAKCKDLFDIMGKQTFHVGPLGSGLAMKLVNNMLVQVNTVAVAEALVLGVKAGLDPQTIYEVVRVSTGASAAWELRVPRILKGDFAPGGTIDISYKDQELETAFAKRLRAQGHVVLTPSLDGCAERKGQVRAGITTETHAAEIADLLFYQDLKDVVLAGTSTGGMVMARAAELARDRVARVVFADALALLDGEALPDIVKRPTAVNTELTSGPSRQDFETCLFADLDPAMRRWALDRCTMHPIAAMQAPVKLERFWDEAWNASVIWCKRSTNPPQAHQRRTADRLKGRWHELDTGHYPMLTEPEGLARLIAEG